MKIINRKQSWKDIRKEEKGNCRGKQVILIREH